MTQSVRVIVITDLTPDYPKTITKSETELPSKFFVDYINELHKDQSTKDFDIPQNPREAFIYESLEDCKEKRGGRKVDSTISAAQNGIKTNDLVLCFFLTNSAG